MQMVGFEVRRISRPCTICHHVLFCAAVEIIAVFPVELLHAVVSGFCFTFSIKHFGDVQELFSHLEGSVQVTNGVVLWGDTVTVRHVHV